MTLLALAAAGVVAGFVLIRAWPAAGPATPAAPAGALDGAAAPGAGGLPPLPDDGRSGSSLSVVGGLGPEDLARVQQQARGRVAAEAAPAPAAGGSPEVQVVPTVPGREARPAGAAPGSMAGSGPPASSLFPPAVQAAARRYICLCGCPDNLADCACNEQPIGAMTMLSYLQKLVDEGRDAAGQDAGMADRYGPRVLAGADGP